MYGLVGAEALDCKRFRTPRVPGDARDRSENKFEKNQKFRFSMICMIFQIFGLRDPDCWPAGLASCLERLPRPAPGRPSGPRTTAGAPEVTGSPRVYRRNTRDLWEAPSAAHGPGTARYPARSIFWQNSKEKNISADALWFHYKLSSVCVFRTRVRREFVSCC